jgi:hypothetical protein
MDGTERPRDADRPTSRRSLLAGGLAALATIVVQERAPQARAGVGDPILLGTANQARRTTSIANPDADETTLRVRARGSAGIALDGRCERGTALHGLSTHGNGVSGETVFGTAVSGLAIEPGSYAVSGNSNAGVGVQGGSDSGVGVQGNCAFGVAVEGANVSETSPAVRGWAQNGQTGVAGLSTAPGGDVVASPTGVGVFGACDDAAGRGVLARSTDGLALETDGRVRFSTSGVATVPAGSSQVLVTPAFEVTSSAKVLAMPRSDPGTASVRWVEPDAAANAFTIHMSGNVTSDTVVAWFVFE